jgi:hypothetical protein
MDREAAAQLGRATELVRWTGKQRRRAWPSDRANAGEEDPEDCRDGEMAGQCDLSEIWKVGLTGIAWKRYFLGGECGSRWVCFSEVGPRLVSHFF